MNAVKKIILMMLGFVFILPLELAFLVTCCEIPILF